MRALLEVESTLTDRYQTTVPEPVRLALKLGKRDRIRYVVRSSGEVVLLRVSPNHEDPALAPFLAMLERDIAGHPERLRPLDDAFTRLQTLVEGVEVDLSQSLTPEDE
jgi:antitoxin PrlF